MKEIIIFLILILSALPCHARMSIVVVGGVTAVTASCTTAADSETGTTTDTPSVGMASGYEYVANAFTTTSAYDLCKITLRLKKVGSPTFNVKVRIYGTTSDHPGSQVGQDSDVIASSTFTTSEADYTFTFSGTKPSLSSSSVYWIAIIAVSPPNDWSNYIQFGAAGVDTLCGAAGSCQMSSADGSTWSNYSDRLVKYVNYK